MWLFGCLALVTPAFATQDKIVLEARGHLAPVRKVQVPAKMAVPTIGTLVDRSTFPGGAVVGELLVKDGQKVKAGEVLARLDDASLKLALKRVQAQLALAEARYDKLRADKASRADLRVAEAEISLAGVEVEELKYRLGNATIVAPCAGTATMVITEGALVHPWIHLLICEIVDMKHLEVDVAVAERDLSKVFRGQKCTIRAEAFPGRAHMGEVSGSRQPDVTERIIAEARAREERIARERFELRMRELDARAARLAEQMR